MKNLMMIVMIAIGVSSFAFGQEKTSKNNSVEAQIIALEKASWEAWKNRDAKWYQNNLTDDALNVTSGSVSDKSQQIKNLGDCEVKSFSLDNFKFLSLDKNAALITFTAVMDAVCNGKTVPSTALASSVYVKRDGKWLNILYTDTPAAQ